MVYPCVLWYMLYLSLLSEQKATCIGEIGNLRDSRVRALVSTREGDLRARSSARSTSSNLDLEARRIELSAGVGICAVQSDQLVSDDIGASLEARGDLEGVGIASRHEGCL